MPPKRNLDSTASQKATRLYSKLLFSGRKLYLNELTEEFDCSKPTIMRLIDAIESSGAAQIERGLDSGRRWYQLRHLPGMPRVGLTGGEVEKLALCRDLLERFLPKGIERAISEGIEKISALMPSPEGRADATAPKAGRIECGRIDATASQEHMETLLVAIRTHTVCSVLYREQEYRYPDEEPRNYMFVPIRFSAENEVLNAEGWLVTEGMNAETVHPLTLALHRIMKCKPTGQRLESCPELPEHEGAFGLIGYKDFPVRVAFCREFSGYIKERFWSKGQEIIDLPDGGVELHFHASDENELMGWVLSFGNGAELIEPDDIRGKLLGELEDLVEVYSRGGE